MVQYKNDFCGNQDVQTKNQNEIDTAVMVGT